MKTILSTSMLCALLALGGCVYAGRPPGWHDGWHRGYYGGHGGWYDERGGWRGEYHGGRWIP